MKILGVIPARYASSRFPGKPLVDIDGKTMIQRVYEQCMKAESLSKVIVATDDMRIFDKVKSFGGEVMMTDVDHLNGTSRCAEVLHHFEEILLEPIDYVINIQGDEPLIDPKQIDDLASLFEDENAEIVTQAKRETDLSLLENLNIVKAILDKNNFAIVFKRNLQLTTYDSQPFYKHVGIYGFKADVLNKIVHLEPSQNELQHKLEQLRWLDNSYKIKVGITEYESISIDTEEDLERVRKTLNS